MAFSQRLFLCSGKISYKFIDILRRSHPGTSDEWDELLCHMLNFYMYTMHVEVMGMVLKVVAEGTLSQLKDPNDRQERIEFWVSAMKDEIVSQVMNGFTLAVDKDALLADNGPDGWLLCIKYKLARLADDILLFQVAHGAPFRLFTNRSFRYFDIIITGKLYGEDTPAPDLSFPVSSFFADWAKSMKESVSAREEAAAVADNSVGGDGQ